MFKKRISNETFFAQSIVSQEKQLKEPARWSHKIDQYLVLCIYQQDKKYEYEKHEGDHFKPLPLEKRIDANTFIIWDRTYRESEELFVNIRIAARNRLIRWIAHTITAFLLKRYENYKKVSSFKALKYSDAKIELIVEHMEQMIKANTFLSEDAAWDELVSSLQIQLTELVLEEIEKTIGFEEMDSLSSQALNELFYQTITMNFSSNGVILSDYIRIVNDYATEWINRIMTSMNITSYSVEKIEALLQMSNFSDQQSIPQRKDILYTLAANQFLHVMNNAPYQYIREALYKKKFTITDESPWPMAPLYKGNIEGSVQFRPLYNEETETPLATVCQDALRQVNNITDLEVDIFDALCSIFLLKNRYSEDIVEIQFDDLLVIRGLKSKLGGEGRRGGFEQKQREQILKSLTMIQSLWIELDKATIYQKGKPFQTQLQGRTFLFVTNNREEYDISKQINQKKFTFTVDKVFAKYLNGSGRQIALLPLQTLQYNPYRQTWEKRLARYFSWRWRTQARKGDFLQPNKIRTLMDAIGESLNERAPSRTRDRLEKALDQLLEDGIIVDWHYNNWDEMVVNSRGWVRIWLNATIIVTPSDVIKEQYQSIERTKKNTHSLMQQSTIQNQQQKAASIGEQMRCIRKQLCLSIIQVAEDLEISSSYVSSIERGIKTPSVKVQNKIMKWMQRFN